MFGSHFKELVIVRENINLLMTVFNLYFPSYAAPTVAILQFCICNLILSLFIVIDGPI